MKLFKCDAQQMAFDLVDLPRPSWRVLPPRKWQIALTLAGVIIVSVLWSVL